MADIVGDSLIEIIVLLLMVMNLNHDSLEYEKLNTIERSLLFMYFGAIVGRILALLKRRS